MAHWRQVDQSVSSQDLFLTLTAILHSVPHLHREIDLESVPVPLPSSITLSFPTKWDYTNSSIFNGIIWESPMIKPSKTMVITTTCFRPAPEMPADPVRTLFQSSNPDLMMCTRCVSALRCLERLNRHRLVDRFQMTSQSPVSNILSKSILIPASCSISKLIGSSSVHS